MMTSNSSLGVISMAELIRYLTSTLTAVTFFPVVGVIVLLFINKELLENAL